MSATKSKRIVNSPSLTMTDTSNLSMGGRSFKKEPKQKTTTKQRLLKAGPSFKRGLDHHSNETPIPVLNCTSMETEYDDVIYDPKDRGQTCYNLRVRRYAKPYWIRDGTSKRYGIQRKISTLSQCKSVGKYETFLKETKINEKKFFARRLTISPELLAVEDKLKMLKDHDLFKPKMKQEKKRGAGI